ncbi:protein kinase domain-containing protein [Melittangium boletus]|uniref:protein kinase domain-containing protein n=1 Tax=Melittangium boletus TaxID=83453 RepID=UPI003DA6BD4F
MLCQRCGSLVPDNSASCATCGLKLSGGAPGSTPRRRAGGVEAPYKAGDVFAKRYAIREVIGPGPVGHVFRALDQEMDVEVALKVINPRLVQMQEERTQFSLALRAGKKLTHPHHVRVYEEGEDRNRPFFTTQLLEGMTLRRMLEQRASQGQRFTVKEAEPLLAQLAEALEHAHKYGPHSNLKPENILLLPDLLKVTDYGLALGIPRLPFIQAQKSWKVGCYLAPEYSEGGELDTRMDIYALGVILGELLTGQMPEEGEVSELLAYEADLPQGVEALYRRATNSNPLARPKSASEFLSEFSAALSSRPRPAAKPAPLSLKGRGKAVPFSLTAELATAAPPSANALPPPVPTTELPTLGTPTIQVPTVQPGAAPTQEAPRSTVETPVAVAPTLEMPHAAAPTEVLTAESLAQRGISTAREAPPPPDATQKLDSEALAAIMATPPRQAGAPKGRPAPAAPRAEPRPAAKAAAGKAKAAAPAPASKAWMVALAIGGLAVGAVAGYSLLKMRGGTPPAVEPSAGAPAATALTPPGAGEGGVAGALGSCPQGMRYVSGGAFKMGKESADEGPRNESALISRQVSAFCIDEFEFPNQAGVAPRVGVSWQDARNECAKMGRRLCSEEEWEKACKGPGNLRFPYGTSFEARRCNTEGNAGERARSGAFTTCRSGYGVMDLSGNVAEWTESEFGDARGRVQKGGSFSRQEISARCASRASGEPEMTSGEVGFRCCMGVKR